MSARRHCLPQRLWIITHQPICTEETHDLEEEGVFEHPKPNENLPPCAVRLPDDSWIEQHHLGHGTYELCVARRGANGELPQATECAQFDVRIEAMEPVERGGLEGLDDGLVEVVGLFSTCSMFSSRPG